MTAKERTHIPKNKVNEGAIPRFFFVCLLLCESENFSLLSTLPCGHQRMSYTIYPRCFQTSGQDVVFPCSSKGFSSSHQVPLAKVVHLFYYLGVIFCRSERRVMAGGVVGEQKYTPYRLQRILRFCGATTAPGAAR